MPSPKRWFPVSRDLNDDPEVWEFTDEFGDRALRIVLEVFASIDRTDNHWRLSGRWLASLSRKVRQQPATVQRALGWMLAKCWLVAEERSADGSPTVLSAVNYWKYHKRRETEGGQLRLHSGTLNGSPPSLPNIPNIPNRTEEKEVKREEEGLLGGKKGNGAENQRPQKRPWAAFFAHVTRTTDEENLPEHLRTVEHFSSVSGTIRNVKGSA